MRREVSAEEVVEFERDVAVFGQLIINEWGVSDRSAHWGGIDGEGDAALPPGNLDDEEAEEPEVLAPEGLPHIKYNPGFYTHQLFCHMGEVARKYGSVIKLSS
jgi:hypothetical protein